MIRATIRPATKKIHPCLEALFACLESSSMGASSLLSDQEMTDSVESKRCLRSSILLKHE
jgi:hypothetical protein